MHFGTSAAILDILLAILGNFVNAKARN